MSDPSPPPLDPRLRELLRDEAPAPADVRARARARLALGIPAAGGGGGGGHHAGGAMRAASGALGSHGVALIALGAFVVGGAAGAGLHAALTRAPAPRVVYVTTLAPPTPPIAPSAPTSALGTAPSAPPTAQSAPPVAAPIPTLRGSGLTAERSALDAARASLVQGDPGGALERLRASRREFPHAILAEERDALTVEALVGVHHDDEARAAAAAFHEHFPDSLFSGAVDTALRAIP